MTAKPSEAATAEATAYARKLTLPVAREPVSGAIATLDGLRRWRTTIVTGSDAALVARNSAMTLLSQSVQSFMPTCPAWVCSAAPSAGQGDQGGGGAGAQLGAHPAGRPARLRPRRS